MRPTTWVVIGVHGDRATLQMNCSRSCSIPLRVAKPGPGRAPWGWDGNVEAPTVFPSIDCAACGWHATITKGQATEQPR